MAENAEGVTGGKECISCRDVLWYLIFCGFAINSMQKASVGLAIVAMVIPRSKSPAISQCQYAKQPTSNLSNLRTSDSSSVKNISEQNFVSSTEFRTTLENTTASLSSVQYPDRFAWNEFQQGLVLGGNFWLQWATQLPGGLLARRYGTKFVFGWGNLTTALLGFLIPLCARYHLYALVSLRVLQGFFTGFAWSSVHNMTAKWVPPNERSKFVSSYLGNSVGIAMTYPIAAMLINWFGWDSVFYVTSTFGVVWYGFWCFLAHDTPQKHPRISQAERTYILESLGDSVDHVCSSQRVPWRAILTSKPLWITAIASCGGCWGPLTLASEAPSYFNYIHGWNISATGMLSAAPHLMRMLFSYVFASFADWLLRTKRMSVTRLRKFAMFICNCVQGILWLGLALSGCHPILAIVFMIAGTAVSGSICAGTLASCIDLSPNYASIISGICNLVTAMPGFISPLIVGILTNNNQTIEQWRLVYLITVTIMFSTGALYIFFGTSELQPWNSIENKEKGEELRKLRSNDVGEVECDNANASNTR